MHQMMGGGKKTSSSNSNPLMGLATSFLGGGSHGSSGSKPNASPASSLVGALAGQFMAAGKKTDEKPPVANYSGAQPSGQGQNQGGFLGGMFGGHNQQQQGQQVCSKLAMKTHNANIFTQGGNYGYSQHNNPSGGYSGAAPPSCKMPEIS
jgi:hypothetical protein